MFDVKRIELEHVTARIIGVKAKYLLERADIIPRTSSSFSPLSSLSSPSIDNSSTLASPLSSLPPFLPPLPATPPSGGGQGAEEASADLTRNTRPLPSRNRRFHTLHTVQDSPSASQLSLRHEEMDGSVDVFDENEEHYVDDSLESGDGEQEDAERDRLGELPSFVRAYLFLSLCLCLCLSIYISVFLSSLLP